jgi:hypothetical protein
MWLQFPTTMSDHNPMWWMASVNDMAGITCLLDEKVDPADEERSDVRRMMGRCVDWIACGLSTACV